MLENILHSCSKKKKLNDDFIINIIGDEFSVSWLIDITLPLFNSNIYFLIWRNIPPLWCGEDKQSKHPGNSRRGLGCVCEIVCEKSF